MNTFDIVIAAILVYGFVRGFLRGFFVEIASLIGLIAGIYGAMHFSFYAGNLLSNYFSWDERTLTIVSFAITFGIIVLAIALLGKLLTKMADVALLGMLNKIFGGIFGALKIGVILSIVFLILSKLNDTIPFIPENQQEESALYKPIKNLATTLLPNFIEVVDEKAKEFNISKE
ncbi:CvpA family protein [Lutibacter sp. HS1-25]|uniref:CvpA family protein n=1 Tax=Lutibacter sp. HS1-25 TaxID=2485000 RepID=UPI001013B3C7|nr:CvpA family protein [Lutibacter sp. HS1-25]RXP59400.1 CvpA family protein [Lutibacter sp. HS1-25]